MKAQRPLDLFVAQLDFSWKVVSAAFVALLLLPFHSAWSAVREVRYKETTLDLHDGDHLLIMGVRGEVHLLQPPMPAKSDAGDVMKAASSLLASNTVGLVTLKARKFIPEHSAPVASARFDSLTLVVRREGNTVIVEGKGPQNKNEWADWTTPVAGSVAQAAVGSAASAQNAAPEMVFEINASAGLQIPTEVVLHDGSVQAQNWRAGLAVSLVQGNVKTTNTEGDLKIQLQKGDMKLVSHRGPVEIDSYSARLAAEDVEGDLRLDNFAGESTLKGIQGNLQLKTYAGGTALAKSSGALDFELGRGALNVDSFEGPVRGQTETAAVVAAVDGETDVNIQSAQGPVNVKLPVGSSAQVHLQTETGSLVAPESIRPGSTSVAKTAAGRLKGDGPRGTVTVTSKTASIRIRGATSRQMGSGERLPASEKVDSPVAPPAEDETND